MPYAGFGNEPTPTRKHVAYHTGRTYSRGVNMPDVKVFSRNLATMPAADSVARVFRNCPMHAVSPITVGIHE
jgi:hypothetical protein